MERHGSRSQKGPYKRKSDRKSFFSKMKDSFRDYVLVPSWLSGSDTPMKDKTGPKLSTSTEPAPSTSSGYLGVGYSGTRPFQSQTMGMPNGQLEYAGSEQPQLGNVEIPFQSPNLQPPITEFTSSLLPLNRLTEKSDSVLANDDTMSQRSDASKSTSGCSSMVPQLDGGRRDSGIEKRKASDQETQGSRSPPSPGLQPTAKRPRLNVSMGSGNRTWTQRFNETVSSHPARSNLKRPAFNPSLFGSPLNDTSVLGTNFHESSFYSGKTVYGGRSSFRSTQKNKIDLNQSLPSRLTFPVKSFVKAKPRSNPVREAVTSSTAKRILDVLDRMPTPLADAKKIPVIVPRNWTQSPSFFSKDVTSSSVEPPTRRQTIAVLADISKNRQTSSGPKSQHTSSTKPETSTSSFAAVGSQREETASSSASGKMRREKSYHRGSTSVKPSLNEEDTVIIAPTLRTDFTLPVASIPQFNFATPSSKQPSTQTSNTTSMPAALNFTFSSPIVEKVAVSKPASPQNVGGFQFSSPISLDKKEEPSKNLATNKAKAAPAFNLFSTPSNMKMSFSTAPKAKANINGPADSGNEGFKPANELRQGSVMDILGGSSSASSLTTSGATTSAPLSTLFKQTGWTCDTCLISNKAETNKCIACQSPKPGPKQQNGVSSSGIPTSQGSSSGVPLSALFKQSGWNCDACLLNNKEDADKCMACSGPKPGAKKQTGTTGTPLMGGNTFSQGSSSGVPLSSLFKQSGWNCDACLINNKEDAVKCVACSGPKPGAKTQTGQSEKPSLLSKNSVLPGNWVCKSCLIQNKAEDNVCGACKTSKSAGTSQDAPKQNDLMMKFKPLPGQWDCEVCLIQNKLDADNCLACQSPKPLKCFKPPPGDWECDTCLVNNKEKDVKCVACGYSRPGPPRTQAVPNCAKSFSMSQPSGFSFTSTSNSDSTKDTSTSVNSGFKFGTMTGSNTSAFKLGAPSNSEISSKKAESGFKLGNSSETVPATSGFKFGTANSSESVSNKSGNLISTGGFKFGTVDSSEDKKSTSDNSVQKVEEKNTSSSGPNKDSTATPSGGFKFGISASQDRSSTSTTSSTTFGVSTSKNSTSVGGFQFGLTSSVGSSTSGISHSLTSSSVLSNSIAVSSSQTVVVPPGKTNSLTPGGGFTLPTSQGAGGFNMTSNSSKDTNSTPATSSAFTGFAFGGSKASEATPKTDAQKNVFGGLNTDKPGVVTSTQAFGGFNFAQKKDEGKTSGNTLVNSSDNVATKRGRDEDPSETVTKKGNYSFGSNNASSTPFQFGAAANSSSQSSSSPFLFGQQNSTTTQAGGFPFTMNKSVDTSKTVFGGAKSSTQTTSAAPVFGNSSAMFGFTGQKPEQPSNTSSATINAGLFNSFGGASKPTAAPAAVPPTFNFGGANTNSSTFGTGSGNCFGGNAPSSMTAFGATPPVFGSTNTGTVTTTAPAFGGKSCLKTYSQPLCVTSVFLSSNLSISSSSCNTLTYAVSTEKNVCQSSASKLMNFTLKGREHNKDETTNTEGKLKVYDNGGQTDNRICTDIGLQTEFKTVILKDQGLQTETEIDTKQIPLQSMGVIPRKDMKGTDARNPYKSVDLPLSNKQCCRSFHSYPRSLLCMVDPIYCTATCKNNFIPVSATEVKCREYLIDKNTINDGNGTLTTSSINLINNSLALPSYGISKSFPVIMKTCRQEKNLIEKSGDKPEGLFVKPFENVKSQPFSCIPSSSCLRMKSFLVTTCSFTATSTVLVSLSQKSNPPTLSTCKTFGKQEESHMDTEISPNTKLLPRAQCSTDQPGPSGLELSGVRPNRLINDLKTCVSTSQSSMLKSLVDCQPLIQQTGTYKFGKNNCVEGTVMDVRKGDLTEGVECFSSQKAVGTNVCDKCIIVSNIDSSRKVCFAFAPPVNIVGSKCNLQTHKSHENIGSIKSILKQKTKEMVSAFNCTSMLDKVRKGYNTINELGRPDSACFTKNISDSPTFSIFGGAKSFCNLTPSQEFPVPTCDPQSASTYYGKQSLPKSSFLMSVEKDKTYFTLGKSDSSDSDELQNDHKPRNSSNLSSRFKQFKTTVFDGLGPQSMNTNSTLTPNMQSNIFSEAVKKPNSIAVVAPVEHANVFRFNGNSDANTVGNHCTNGLGRICGTNGISASQSEDFPSSYVGYLSSTSSKKTSNTTEKLSGVFGGLPCNKTDKSSNSNLFVFGGSANKKSSIAERSSSTGVLMFKVSSSMKSNQSEKSSNSSLFVFGGSSNKKSTIEEQRSSSRVFVFGSADNKPKVTSESKLTSARRNESNSTCTNSTSSESNTSVSSEDSTSSDSDSSDSSSSSSSSSTLPSDDDQEASRMECSANDIEGLTNGEQRNFSQNSCSCSESISGDLACENCVHSSLFSSPINQGGVFQFGADKASAGPPPSQTSSAVFQFGGKPPENAQPTPNSTGFNFNAAAQAGLGGSGFNFSPAAAPGSFAFSASPTPGTGERKIKKAVRKLRR